MWKERIVEVGMKMIITIQRWDNEREFLGTILDLVKLYREKLISREEVYRLAEWDDEKGRFHGNSVRTRVQEILEGKT